MPVQVSKSLQNIAKQIFQHRDALVLAIVFSKIATVGALVVSAFAFIQSRLYVRRRLQFVDAVHSPAAPFIAGGLALALATPIVWIMPFVGFGSALLFGAAVGFGVARGSRDVRKRLPHGS